MERIHVPVPIPKGFTEALYKAGKAIPVAELKHMTCYSGQHRQTSIAMWLANENRFAYARRKFGDTFLDYANSLEDDDGFALFIPQSVCTDEEEIALITRLYTLKGEHYG